MRPSVVIFLISCCATSLLAFPVPATWPSFSSFQHAKLPSTSGPLQRDFSPLLETLLHPTSFLAHSTEASLPPRSPQYGSDSMLYVLIKPHISLLQLKKHRKTPSNSGLNKSKAHMQTSWANPWCLEPRFLQSCCSTTHGFHSQSRLMIQECSWSSSHYVHIPTIKKKKEEKRASPLL